MANQMFIYRRMTPDQFRQAMADTGLGGETLAKLTGETPRRIAKWAHGEDEIPHRMTLLMGLLSRPENRALAWKITDMMLEGMTPAAIERLRMLEQRKAEESHG